MPGLTFADPAGFSGQIYFFYPDGQFFWGILLRDGKPAGSVIVSEKTDASEEGPATRVTACILVYGGYHVYFCPDGPKGDCYYVGSDITWHYMVCKYDGPGGNGGGDFIDDGWGGAGGGPSGPPSLIAPNANKIFKNPNMSTEDWNKLEALVEKIIDDCMGKMLYNNLSNKMSSVSPINIKFDSSISGGKFGVSGGEATITLGAIEDHVLLHEMMHAYQNLNGNNSGSLNNEIEAWVAQYRLCSKSPDYVPGDYYYEMYTETPLGRSVQRLSEHMDSKGGLIKPLSDFNAAYQNTVEWFQNTWGYHTYTYDSSVTGLNNFKNLIEFSKGC